jgi:hypothetical protein
MSDKLRSRGRCGEAFWRARHEAWVRSELNQREYCEAYGIPLKAFGNWRAKFKAEPQPPAPKLLYRRGGLSHALSHGLSHGLSHMTYDRPTSEIITSISRGYLHELGLNPAQRNGVYEYRLEYMNTAMEYMNTMARTVD